MLLRMQQSFAILSLKNHKRGTLFPYDAIPMPGVSENVSLHADPACATPMRGSCRTTKALNWQGQAEQ